MMALHLSRKLSAIAAALIVLPVVVSCGQQTAQNPVDSPAEQTLPNTAASPNAPASADATASTNDVVGVVAGNPSLSMLATAINNTGLSEELRSGEAYTIFAPSDQAFAALPEETRQALMQPENRDDLRQLLAYHVVSGNLTSDKLESSQLQSLEGTPLTVNLDSTNKQVKVNNATVTQADIPASNGVIHVVDQVILPPNVSQK